MMKFNYDVMIDRSVGDFPEQQRPPGPDPEMSGGLPGVQESPVCKVSPSLYPLLPSLYPDLYRLCIFGGYITIAISHFYLYKLYILNTSVHPLKRKKLSTGCLSCVKCLLLLSIEFK